jgi:protein-tyrosine-phosphatase/predicted ATP-grasp superfamily ATP-dependent carboligase
MEPEKVLVLGDDSRAFLAVVRSLGRRGLRVHVCPFDYASPALRSRYIAAVHRLPPYNLDPEAWVAAVAGLFAAEGFSLVVPCDDRSILPLQRHREAWGTTRIALPNQAAFEAFFDKGATRELAIAAGVPVAPGEILGPGVEAGALVARYGLPLALKPRRSFALERIAARRSVSILAEEAGLAEALAHLSRPADFLVEGFFEGSGVGVSILAAEGEVLQAFQHHRVSESGPTGGSTYRVSAALDPALLAATEALARAASLTGVAMFEYRRDMATGRFVLLEVNARFWGSLPLAVAAGIDFPAQLFDLLVHGRRTPRIAYRVGHYARSISNDAYRLARDLGDRARPLPARVGGVVGEVAVGLARTAVGRETTDAFARDDLLPWLGEWRGILDWIFGGASRRVPGLGRFGLGRRRRGLAALLAREPGRQRSLLVLCFGNICRSPYAAKLLAEKLAGPRPDITVTAAGFLAEEGRRSPDTAIAVAAELGTDLALHRSAYARDEALRGADAILLFDGANLGELARRGIATEGRVFLLGAFAEPPGEIEDPYGAPPETFRETYARIGRAVDAIVAELKG